MTHLTIQEWLYGRAVDQLEKVSDAQYGRIVLEGRNAIDIACDVSDEAQVIGEANAMAEI